MQLSELVFHLLINENCKQELVQAKSTLLIYDHSLQTLREWINKYIHL